MDGTLAPRRRGQHRPQILGASGTEGGRGSRETIPSSLRGEWGEACDTWTQRCGHGSRGHKWPEPGTQAALEGGPPPEPPRCARTNVRCPEPQCMIAGGGGPGKAVLTACTAEETEGREGTRHPQGYVPGSGRSGHGTLCSASRAVTSTHCREPPTGEAPKAGRAGVRAAHAATGYRARLTSRTRLRHREFLLVTSSQDPTVAHTWVHAEDLSAGQRELPTAKRTLG